MTLPAGTETDDGGGRGGWWFVSGKTAKREM